MSRNRRHTEIPRIGTRYSSDVDAITGRVSGPMAVDILIAYCVDTLAVRRRIVISYTI